MLECTRCRGRVPLPAPAGAGTVHCRRCEARLEISVFPALFRPLPPGRPGEAVLSDGESACFYHPKKRAVVPCGACGRFLCSLCDLDFSDQHYCPPCLETARGGAAFPPLLNQRTCYDRIALALAVYPLLLFFYPTLFTAPVALFLSVRALRAPGSLVHGAKTRSIAAMLLATVEIVAWAVLINLIITQIRKGA